MNWNVKEIHEAANKAGIDSNDITQLIDFLPEKRNSLANNCIHMYFTLAAAELNNIGHSFSYIGLKGDVIELQWTAELFKNTVWRSLQTALTEKESTKNISHKDIQLIYEALNKWFGEKGIYIPYPNRQDEDFSKYMKRIKKYKKQ